MIARQMRSYAWNDGKELHIGRDSLVMGVLNITDDSFSDGGKWDTLETAMKHAKDMVEDGAAIVDIGAESTRQWTQHFGPGRISSMISGDSSMMTAAWQG